MLLDYDGTLIELKKRPELAGPDQELLRLLSAFQADPKNKVVIVSGRDRVCLSDWLGVTGVDLVAEHGAWLREAEWNNWHLKEEGLNLTPKRITSSNHHKKQGAC